MTEELGFIAATLTTTAFIPQAYKVYKTKQTDGLSVLLFAMFSAGVALWLIYGLLSSQLPIIIANIITLPLALYILAVTLLNRRESRE
jgi:MtN3 and saliva related transmembrane protein